MFHESAFTETDFLRLWKGLFYCMWMSDKPLVQEDLAESLSRLVHCFNTKDTMILYTKCTFKSLGAEWFGIDRFRIDKFEMVSEVFFYKGLYIIVFYNFGNFILSNHFYFHLFLLNDMKC